MELFTEITALAALAVVAVQQILKLNVVPVFFANKYPLTTNILLSIAASVFVQYQTVVSLVGWVEWVTYVAVVSIVAAITYNNTLRNSDKVQAVSSRTS